MVRPTADGVEACLLNGAVCVGYAQMDADDDVEGLTAAALIDGAPRTGPEERAVVLRWLATLSASARLVYLAPDCDERAAVRVAAEAVLAERRAANTAARETSEV